MAKIFVSYRRQDSPYVALALKDRLERQFGQDSVFLDIDNIPLGMDFREHIDRAVQQCDVMLVLIGDAWLAVMPDKDRNRLFDPQDFVRTEIEAALRRSIPIVPVLVENAKMPGAEDLPPSIQNLIYRNAAEVRAGLDFNSHMTRLSDNLGRLFPTPRLGMTTESEEHAPEPPSVVLRLNNGVKPSFTLFHHGLPTIYRVDGRIVEHVDGTQSQQPAPFRCEVQRGGIVGGWDVEFQDGDWANVILGSFEDVFPASSKGLTATQSWTPIGKNLVIRRGKMGQHVRVPDSGAIVEVIIRTKPRLATPVSPMRLRVARTGDTAIVTQQDG